MKYKCKRTKKHLQNPPLAEGPYYDATDDIHIPNAQPSQYFHIDAGFVRYSNFTENKITANNHQ